MLFLLFFALHNSALGLSWLLERSYLPIYRALRRVMLTLRSKAKPVRMSRIVKSDEIYVTAGLKSRNNGTRIRLLGRSPRRHGIRRRGREC